MAAEVNFDTKIVAKALDDLINEIVRVVSDITEVYSDPSKCTLACASFAKYCTGANVLTQGSW